MSCRNYAHTGRENMKQRTINVQISGTSKKTNDSET